MSTDHDKQFSTKKLQQIAQRTKDAVFGFIKQNGTLLISENNAYYNNIPPLISFICLAYYYDDIAQSFEDMNLSKDLLRGIYSYGLEKPSVIQQRSIIPMIRKHDIILKVQFGAGSIHTYCIAALQQINLNDSNSQILILDTSSCPCCFQYREKTVKSLGQYMNITTRSCFSRDTIRNDIEELRKGIQVIIGKPGRTLDLISRGALQLNSLKMIILDQMEDMLSRGYKDQIYEILECLSSNVQIVLLSCLISTEISEFIAKFMKNPLTISSVDREELVSFDDVKQYYIAVEKEDYKLATLYDLFECIMITQVIIYCNTRRKVMWLTDKMKQQDFTVSCIHGNMDKKERELIMKEFRSGSIRVFIITDLLQRGSNVDNIPLVINYDLPLNRENYISRVGRKAKYRGKSVVMNFVTDADEKILRDIETFYNIKIDELPMELDGIMN